jgi:hypothetical protein
MNQKLFYLLLCVAFLLNACTTTRIVKSSVPPAEVVDIAYFPPIAQIQLINQGNAMVNDDSISQLCAQKQLVLMGKWKERMHITSEIQINDALTKLKLEKESIFLVQKGLEYLKSQSEAQFAVKLPPVMDSILKTTGKRFGMITINEGFTRTKVNYTNEVTKSVAVSLLTLGTYRYTPIKANSSLFVLIIDAKSHNVAFFRRSFLNGEEPLKDDIIKRQLLNIFIKYFWTQEQADSWGNSPYYAHPTK